MGVAPTGMALIPAGTFVMGAATNVGHEADAGETPQHTVNVSAFYMDTREVTKELWDSVYDWATEHGYTFSSGCGLGKQGGADTHPVNTVNWYDSLKWCNARSEQAGLAACYTVSGEVYRVDEQIPECDFRARGYRLPTEAEWEKAARGGVANRRFPWPDTSTIQHARANYNSWGDVAYDTSPTQFYHPDYDNAPEPYTSPVGMFAANGYGLYDMAGNVLEWCWDFAADDYYSSSPERDPTGPTTDVGVVRVLRGGSWYSHAQGCCVSSRNRYGPWMSSYEIGFRTVRAK